MFYLSAFDKKKIVGLVNLNHTDGQTNAELKKAIDCFNETLKIKEDASLYAFISLALYHLEKYREAQEYALKAIEKGYNAYGLYSKITVGKLDDLNSAIEVLTSGVEKKEPLACFEMARLYLENETNPEMVDCCKGAEYLDLTYEYTPITKRGVAAYKVSIWYRYLNDKFPNFKSFKGEDMELHYLKIFSEYDGFLKNAPGTNIQLFNAFDKNDDYSIIDILFNKFDGDAYAIFALLLLQEEYDKTGTINIRNNEGFLTAVGGVLATGNGACGALAALCFASDFEGVVWNPDEANKTLKEAKTNGINIPKRFKSFFKEMMDHLDENVKNGLPEANA